MCETGQNPVASPSDMTGFRIHGQRGSEEEEETTADAETPLRVADVAAAHTPTSIDNSVSSASTASRRGGIKGSLRRLVGKGKAKVSCQRECQRVY
jgi:hypothetical protein